MTADHCEELAAAHGLAAGLTVALSGIRVDQAACGPIAAVPLAAANGDRIPHALAESAGIAFMRITPVRHIATALELAGRLASVRLGLSSTALATVAQRLTGRAAGGEPIARKQLVAGTIAECSIDIDLLREQSALVPTTLDEDCAASVHNGIDRLDWRIATLFGASGYVHGDDDAEPLGCALYVSWLVGHSWVPRGVTHW